MTSLNDLEEAAYRTINRVIDDGEHQLEYHLYIIMIVC